MSRAGEQSKKNTISHLWIYFSIFSKFNLWVKFIRERSLLSSRRKFGPSSGQLALLGKKLYFGKIYFNTQREKQNEREISFSSWHRSFLFYFSSEKKKKYNLKKKELYPEVNLLKMEKINKWEFVFLLRALYILCICDWSCFWLYLKSIGYLLKLCSPRLSIVWYWHSCHLRSNHEIFSPVMSSLLKSQDIFNLVIMTSLIQSLHLCSSHAYIFAPVMIYLGHFFPECLAFLIDFQDSSSAE